MIGIRRLMTCAVAAATLAVPALALAAAPYGIPTTYGSGPKYEHFMAWASGTQVTTWKQPTRSQGDCSYHYVNTPKGNEVVRFRAKPIKVLAIDYGTAVMFVYGTWDPSQLAMNPWPASGSTQRRDLTTTSWTPGPCNPTGKAPTLPKEDCNPTRTRAWYVNLSYYASQQTLGLLFTPVSRISTGRRGSHFFNCPIETTGQAEADTISEARVNFPVKDLLAGYGKQIAFAHQTWSTKPPAPKITTTVNWKLTLVRYP